MILIHTALLLWVAGGRHEVYLPSVGAAPLRFMVQAKAPDAFPLPPLDMGRNSGRTDDAGGASAASTNALSGSEAAAGNKAAPVSEAQTTEAGSSATFIGPPSAPLPPPLTGAKQVTLADPSSGSPSGPLSAGPVDAPGTAQMLMPFFRSTGGSRTNTTGTFLGPLNFQPPAPQRSSSATYETK